jgi:hypothetical protein
VTTLNEDSVRSTLGTVLKYREDQERVEAADMAEIVKAAVRRALVA